MEQETPREQILTERFRARSDLERKGQAGEGAKGMGHREKGKDDRQEEFMEFAFGLVVRVKSINMS